MSSASKTTTAARRADRLGPVDLSRMRRPPTHPGEIFNEEFLKPTEVSQAQAAYCMGMSANRLNEIIGGKRSVTAETAVLFAAYTDTDPRFWLRLQVEHDLWHALRETDVSMIARRSSRT
jgi:addiction module HigA family antidote